jgi:hypothetical protein
MPLNDPNCVPESLTVMRSGRPQSAILNTPGAQWRRDSARDICTMRRVMVLCS